MTAGLDSDELELEVSSESNNSHSRQSHSRRVTSLGSISGGERFEEGNGHADANANVGRPQRLQSRFSIGATSTAETFGSEGRRVSMLAPSTIATHDEVDEQPREDGHFTFGRRGGKKRVSKSSEKDKNCIVQ